MWQAEEQPDKDGPILIPETSDCVTLHGKNDFEDVLKSGILKWGLGYWCGPMGHPLDP